MTSSKSALPTARVRPSYQKAIEWIAFEDEANEMSIKEMSTMISVLLVAHTWNKDPEAVARDIINIRRFSF